ncbi:hypothetical protein JEQ12_020278 [Ovis aries]|uniref:HSF-type DNA-binding domain-containing protein n=1 Tax=Ovis aries TaxID=9940 RepID=A0A836CPC8_SHEEP|nr:hypothetical protein JEQ12_020278 [Ovis aries]
MLSWVWGHDVEQSLDGVLSERIKRTQDLKSVLHTADEELSRSTDRTTEIGSGLSVGSHGAQPRWYLWVTDSAWERVKGRERAMVMETTKFSYCPERQAISSRKLWTIVNSHCFVSIWWAEDSTCVSVNEELFENILERVGSDKVFETDHKKSLFRQLSLYGFSKACQDLLTSLCLTTLLTEEPLICVLSKVALRSYSRTEVWTEELSVQSVFELQEYPTLGKV